MPSSSSSKLEPPVAIAQPKGAALPRLTLTELDKGHLKLTIRQPTGIRSYKGTCTTNGVVRSGPVAISSGATQIRGDLTLQERKAALVVNDTSYEAEANCAGLVEAGLAVGALLGFTAIAVIATFGGSASVSIKGPAFEVSTSIQTDGAAGNDGKSSEKEDDKNDQQDGDEGSGIEGSAGAGGDQSEGGA